MKTMTKFALSFDRGPIAVRYPRGAGLFKGEEPQEIELGKSICALDSNENSLCFIGIGDGVNIALSACQILRKSGVSASVIDARFCKPLDETAIINAARRFSVLATVEDNVLAGGFGSAVLELLSDLPIHAHLERFGLPDQFIEHGVTAALRAEAGFSPEKIAERCLELLPREMATR
jgi:1-deoxy-D-xylulose-5-phosphate synthase